MPGIVLRKGTQIEYLIHASHHDPDFFPDPEKFDPDRFYGDNIKKINPITFRPFGAGPRKCIAERFALAEVKIVAAQMLSHFRFVATPVTKRTRRGGYVFVIDNDGIKIKLESRN